MTFRILPQLRPDQILGFWQKIAITANPDRCWLWAMSRNDAGYGRIRIEWNEYRAHRLAYFLFYGKDPLDLMLCHKCDNPPCCNPHHLFMGTMKDNCQDREKKGRGNQPKGEANAFAKLTADQVRDIRRRYAKGGISYQALADEFHTPCTNIGGICRRIYWAWLE